MSVAFYGTSELVLSFEAGESVTAGYPQTVSHNNTVTDAADGALPAGIALHCRRDIAAVQMKGYVEVPYSGTAPTLGWNTLVADGKGGLRCASGGLSRLVINVDTAARCVGLYL